MVVLFRIRGDDGVMGETRDAVHLKHGGRGASGRGFIRRIVFCVGGRCNTGGNTARVFAVESKFLPPGRKRLLGHSLSYQSEENPIRLARKVRFNKFVFFVKMSPSKGFFPVCPDGRTQCVLPIMINFCYV